MALPRLQLNVRSATTRVVSNLKLSFLEDDEAGDFIWTPILNHRSTAKKIKKKPINQIILKYWILLNIRRQWISIRNQTKPDLRLNLGSSGKALPNILMKSC